MHYSSKEKSKNKSEERQLRRKGDVLNDFSMLSIHDLFQIQAQKTPEKIAVKFGSASITYQQLDQQSSQVARYLIAAGVKPQSLIAICMDRSLEMIVSILGILKSGAAYLPIEPDYPQSRIEYIVDDANLVFILTQSSLVKRLSPIIKNICVIDENFFANFDSALTIEDTDPDENLADNLAYVIYTSGSTGKPKGVMIEHRALVNRIQWMKEHYGCDESDVILQKTPFCFDVSVWEFFLPLVSGAVLVLAKPDGHKDPIYLTELISSQRVTKVHFVPSMFAAFLSVSSFSSCQSLRQIFCSGEALLGAHVNAYFQDGGTAELHNLYGPTEAAIDVSFWHCTPNDVARRTVPIGRAIKNIQLFIINDQQEVVPDGVIGELCIAGVGLARGYLNKPDITAERFLDGPRNNEKPIRFYKTGDLCRYLPDGNIEFLGRADHQVKIRGYRIELGEIESVIMSHPYVNEAVVISRQSKIGTDTLVAYVVSSSVVDVNSILDYLHSHLPNYMVPPFLKLIPEIPITSNGKADRELLRNLALEDSLPSSSVSLTIFQQVILELWERILGFKNYGIDDDLFKVGGDSISAIRIFGLINDEFGVSIPIHEIFSSNGFTVRTLAGLVESYQIELLGEGQYRALLGELESLSEQELEALANS